VIAIFNFVLFNLSLYIYFCIAASEYLGKIKKLKKKMNPKAAKEDDEKNEAMKNQ